MTDQHSEIYSEKFNKWFEERGLPYLGPESVVLNNANVHLVLLVKTSCTNTRKLINTITYNLINAHGVA
jgi:hypothetical protein